MRFPPKRSRSILIGVLVAAWCLAVFSYAAASDYNWTQVVTGCADKALVGELTAPDWPQDKTSQDTSWAEMKQKYGLSDSDRIGNETKKYNCHAYIFFGTNRWLQNPRAYDGTGGGCWSQDASGTVFSSDIHSCKVAEYEGKCGNWFLTKRNDKVYKGDTPTQKYKQN